MEILYLIAIDNFSSSIKISELDQNELLFAEIEYMQKRVLLLHFYIFIILLHFL